MSTKSLMEVCVVVDKLWAARAFRRHPDKKARPWLVVGLMAVHMVETIYDANGERGAHEDLRL